MACINVPTIVAEGSFLAQTEDLAETTLYTVPADGLYRVSGSVRQVSGNGTVTGTIYWTDEVGAESAALLNSASTAPSAISPVVIFCVASSTISVSATVGFPPLEYNLRYAIEAL